MARAAFRRMVFSSAEFSACREYRYSLSRVWDAELPVIAFVGLNPSTAAETVDDPTVRRCIGFAKTWKYGGLILVNLFAFRSTDPAALRKTDDPIGPDNDASIIRHCWSAKRVVVAWGTHGCLLDRDDHVLALLARPFCLGVTNAGAPKHPLYLAGDTRLRPYRRASTPQRILLHDPQRLTSDQPPRLRKRTA